MPEVKNYGVIIQARNNSKRLPGKMSLPFYRGKTILELLLERLQTSLNNIPVYVATSNQSADDNISSMATNMGVKVFRGEENNVLKRMLDASKLFNLENIIRVCADNPFLDMNSISALIQRHLSNPADYTSFKVDDSTPAILSHFGFYAELVRQSALNKVAESTNDEIFLEHVTNYIYNNPKQFKIDLIPAPTEVYGRKDIRLTVDTRQDFELAQSVYRTLIPNDLTIQRVINFIDAHEEIPVAMNQMIKKNKK